MTRKLRGWTDCDDCKAKNGEQARMTYRCPYLPPAPPNLEPFVAVPVGPGFSGETTVCPGYTTSLPETIEVARAWAHWSKGELRAFTGASGPPTDRLVECIEVFGCAVGESQRWCIDNPVKK